MTTVREIMTPDPDYVETDQTLQTAAEKMEQLGVGALPISGKDRRLKGMLTDRDIVVRALARGKALSTPVGELNQGGAVTVAADDTVEHLFATMTRHQVKRIPILEGENLVGIVSLADAARALPDPNTGVLTEALSIG